MGILHTPGDHECVTQRVGIILLNSGIRQRVGPYRQYVKLARRLCQAGFYALRFDFPGIGDSEGDVQGISKSQRQFLDQNDSTTNAIDFLKAETGINRVGLLGLCGGAYSALRAGAADHRVDFLLLLSLPVEDLGDFSERAVSRAVMRQYLRKTLQWRSWLNFILLRSNFRSMSRAIVQLSSYHRRGSLIDESLWQAFEGFTGSGKPVLFIFGGGDPLYRAFVVGFGRRLPSLDRIRKQHYEVHVVERSDHVFSQVRWQEKAFDKSIAWLQDRYGKR